MEARAILTDIEGTTSSLSFVRDVLFPYSRRHLRTYLREHAQEDFVRPILEDVRAREGSPDLDVDGVADALDRWIAEDRKVTSLKALQGAMWKRGYGTGELVSHVYDDAVDGLRSWHARGVALYVYSSGSIEAQRLLFGHTRFGDLTGLFTGFFDTTTGAKLDAASYRAIATSVGLPAADVLFLSDSVPELDAARLAGMETTWLVREGTAEDQPGGDAHRRAATFDAIR